MMPKRERKRMKTRLTRAAATTPRAAAGSASAFLRRISGVRAIRPPARGSLRPRAAGRAARARASRMTRAGAAPQPAAESLDAGQRRRDRVAPAGCPSAKGGAIFLSLAGLDLRDSLPRPQDGERVPPLRHRLRIR